MSDIYVYGEISEWSAGEIRREIESATDEILVHINSEGGDIFSALGLHNLLKKRGAKCVVEGVCASAATLIACGTSEIVMCKNSLMMIHEPLADLFNLFTASELEKVKNTLEKIREMIVEIYVERTGKSSEEIANLMAAETWFNAEEAVENKFADRIEGEAEIELDGDILIANKLRINCKNYDVRKIKAVAKVANDEAKRIAILNSKRGKNEAVNAIIDAGISSGESLEKVQKYIDAVSGISIENQILNLIRDNMSSGAEKVTGSVEEEVDEVKVRAQAIAKFANK